MPSLGRSLAFYLKYESELETLYWDEDTHLLDDVEDSEKIAEMVKAVGDAACNQAADFLFACAEKMMGHCGRFCNTKTRTRRSTVLESDWNVTVGLWAKRRRKPRMFRCQAGVYMDIRGDGAMEIMPWLWARGGEKAENSLARILGKNRGMARSRELGWDTGSIALARIRLEINEKLEFNCGRDQLVTDTVKPFLKMSDKDINKILQLAYERSG